MNRFAIAALSLLMVSAPAAADPLTFFNGRLFVPAEVNGVHTEALLDSAAEATLVDLTFARQNGLPAGQPQTIRGSAGSAHAFIVEGATISSLGLTLHPDAIVETDLRQLSRSLIKRPTKMVLGRELFDAARLRIDIKGRQISVLSAAATLSGIRLPLTEHLGVEHMPVRIGTDGVQAEFDLGNGSGVLISRALADWLKLKRTGSTQGGGIGGSITRATVVIPSLEVAGRSFRDVPAQVDELPNASELNLGTSILKNFIITSDFANRAVWLQPIDLRGKR